MSNSFVSPYPRQQLSHETMRIAIAAHFENMAAEFIDASPVSQDDDYAAHVRQKTIDALKNLTAKALRGEDLADRLPIFEFYDRLARAIPLADETVLDRLDHVGWLLTHGNWGGHLVMRHLEILHENGKDNALSARNTRLKAIKAGELAADAAVHMHNYIRTGINFNLEFPAACRQLLRRWHSDEKLQDFIGTEVIPHDRHVAIFARLADALPTSFKRGVEACQSKMAAYCGELGSSTSENSKLGIGPVPPRPRVPMLHR